MKEKLSLNGSELKIIALIAMTIDHIGFYLFPGVRLLRIIGRLAFPIFAYMIGEGCTYTKNPKRYFLSVFSVGLLCQIVYLFMMHSLSQCIFITFSLSIMLIFAVKASEKGDGAYKLLPYLALSFVFFVTYLLPRLYPDSGFNVDYGFIGALLPLFSYLPKNKEQKLALFSVGLLVLCCFYGGIQFYSLAALLLLALYNGRRGKFSVKYLFYAYYPLHLAALYVIKNLFFEH